ncbi:MAG TPA: hypothetical protein VGH60_04650 [Solirubrobacteraceae bacterium]|jgi:hypothetical protein
MRRTAILLALVLAGSLLTACGKGVYTGAPSTAPAGVTATQGAHAHAHRGGSPTQAQALAFAHAVNLTAADVPGFTPSHKPERESPAERRLQQQLRSCGGVAGASTLRGSRSTLAEASSPDFELERGVLALSVNSAVSVAHTSAQADAALRAIRSPRVRACFSRYLSELLKSQQHTPGETVLGVSIASGTPPASGTTGGFGWRVTARLAIRGIDISLYLDILGFVDGPAQVTLTSSGTVRPFPARAQEQLYSQLLTRARANRL